MKNFASLDDIDFTLDPQNLYLEENFTDLKVGSIRRLVPVRADGSRDTGRTEMFVGTTQMMTNEGPLPVQAQLMANNMQEALQVFPTAMRQATAEMLRELEQLQQRMKTEQDSRIIVPGR